MIFIDKNSASWGSCTFKSIAFIDDSTWTIDDFNEMSNWNDTMIVEYAELYDQYGYVPNYVPPTPTQWATSDYQTSTLL